MVKPSYYYPPIIQQRSTMRRQKMLYFLYRVSIQPNKNDIRRFRGFSLSIFTNVAFKSQKKIQQWLVNCLGHQLCLRTSLSA